MQRIFCKNFVHWGVGNKEDDQQKHDGLFFETEGDFNSRNKFQQLAETCSNER